MKKLILPSLLLLAVAASAVELSLEENRAERGNIGFIDMKKVFTLYPDTARARENFEEAVRQAEDQVNLRKTELLRLRAELAQMKTDREVLASQPTQTVAPAPSPVPAATAPVPLKIVPKAPESAPAPAPEQAPAPALAQTASTTAATAAALPGMGGAQAPAPLTINLPGSEAPTVVQEPSTEIKPLDNPVPTPQDAVTAAPVIETPAMTPVAETPLQLMDKRIAEKQGEIARKDLEYKQHRQGAEKNLLDLEARRSEILLGKIYRAVQEVARKEGVSVVVDKTAILYGHGAVDITEKVLKALKGA